MGFQYSITYNNWMPLTCRVHLIATADHLPNTKGKVSKACSRVWPSLEIPVSKPPVVRINDKPNQPARYQWSCSWRSHDVQEHQWQCSNIQWSQNSMKHANLKPISNVHQSVIFRTQGGQICQISQLLWCLTSYIIPFWHECSESQFWGTSGGPPIYLYQKGWGPLAAKGAEWPIKLEGLEGSKVKLEVGLGNSWSSFILGSLIDPVPAFHWSQDHQVCLAATRVVSQICSSLN